MEPLPLSIAIAVLILLSGFFSGTETAYSCANKMKLKGMVASGKKRARQVLDFADDKYDKLVTAILVGNNIVNITASALGTILFAQLIADQNIATTVSTAVLTVIVLIVGEITPKFLASVYPEKVCFLVYPLLQLFYWVLMPICKIFDFYKNGLRKAFKLKKEDAVTNEELMSLVDEAEEDGTLKEDESELVRSALEFDDLKVEDILVPRVDVTAVDVDSTMDEVLDVFKNTAFSRLPVYRDTIDNVIGLIHEREFFNGHLSGEKNVANLVQNIVFTTEYTRISALLKELQKNKIHMAAVSDEYGGLVGIVTLEDILEELVGEIWDEHDHEEVLFGEINENEYWVDGKCPLDDFLALYELEDEDENFDSNTMGGWATEQYGGIPPVGEVLRFKNVEIKVVKATKQKVLKVLSKITQEAEDGEEDAE